ncbi:hypothetical protein LPJ72_002169 [Coemansia sp. Benny D160-2]|nr:hypothetical protein LPJ72_002169 [Coemansia sp. Benny D160-2]
MPSPATAGANKIPALAEDPRRVFHAAPHSSNENNTAMAHDQLYRSQHVVRIQVDQLYANEGAATDMRFHPYPEIHSNPAIPAIREHNRLYSHHHAHPLQDSYLEGSNIQQQNIPDPKRSSSTPSSTATSAAQPLSATAHSMAQKTQISLMGPTAITRDHLLLASKSAASYRRAKRLAEEPNRRRRRTQACQYCHAKKIKCEGDGERCNSCIKNDIKCKWGMKRKRGPKPKIPQIGGDYSVVVSGVDADSIPGGGGGGAAATGGDSLTTGYVVSTGLMQQPSNDRVYLTTASDAAGHITEMNQTQPMVVSVPTNIIANMASSTTNSLQAHEYVEAEDEERLLLQDQRETPVASDGVGEDDEYDDSFNGSTGIQRLQAPRMDREMEEFFSDKVDSETRDAVVYYFDYFYPLAPMFHPSMFIRRLVNGDVDPLLLDAMKATTARVIQRKTGRSIDSCAIAQSVKSRILAQLETPTADLVRVIVVMTLLAGSQGEHVSYNSLICLAASLVVRLGWHQIDLYKRPPAASWEEWVTTEVRRRVFWLVYQTDSYQAMLTGRPMSIAEDSVYVIAPCSDFEWDVVMNPTSERRNNAKSKAQQTTGTSGNGSNTRVIEKLAQSTQYHRSSRSSSGSAASGGQSLRVDQHAIVATGSFSYSFMALCELTAIIARINTFLCDAKASRPSLLLHLQPPQPPDTSSSAASHTQNGLAFATQQQQQQLAHTPTATLRNGPFPAVDFLDAVAGTGSLVHQVLRTVQLPSEYPTFVELDERLDEWKRNLLLPEELRDDAAEAADITYFGNADHRRFMMRVRYFCLHCYYVPITLFLHQSNRPSFFTEYEQPLDGLLRSEAAAAKKSTNHKWHGSYYDNTPVAASPPLASVSGIGTIPSAASAMDVLEDGQEERDSMGHKGGKDSDDACVSWGQSDSDAALREILNTVFARTWNKGLLAYDIEPRSWGICVQAAHQLSEHLDRNSDLPLERFDQVIPFCIFMSVSVLIRQIRLCNHRLRSNQQSAADCASQDVEVERAKCIRHAKHQWEMLQSLGSLWNVEGMEALLKSMHIDEVTSATDLFESMSL